MGISCLPFSLKVASSVFQRVMSSILSGLSFCIVDIDDILIFSRNEEEHMEHLQIVLQRILNSGLKLKPSKCKLFRKSLKYLGHIISRMA